jgi:hypothetical protein
MNLVSKRKFITAFSLALILILASGAAAVYAAGLLKLPATPVTVTHGPWNGNAPYSTLAITLSDVPAGFDVTNGVYAGWCVEDNHKPNIPVSSGTLIEAAGAPWDKINWLLNNWSAYGDYYDAQIAIWMLTGTNQSLVTPAAQTMLDAANMFGGGFVPGNGQVVAVIAFSDNAIYDAYQDTIIQVPYYPPPPPGDEGCTPGYWRNHFEDWPPTGYAPSDDFDVTFGVDYFAKDVTLGEAVKLGGGGYNKIARHGTAALLSAAHPDVNYPYTVAEVIAFVQSGDVEALVIANELGCMIP